MPSDREIDWKPGEAPDEELMPLSAHVYSIAAAQPPQGTLHKYLLHIGNRLANYERGETAIRAEQRAEDAEIVRAFEVEPPDSHVKAWRETLAFRIELAGENRAAAIEKGRE